MSLADIVNTVLSWLSVLYRADITLFVIIVLAGGTVLAIAEIVLIEWWIPRKHERK